MILFNLCSDTKSNHMNLNKSEDFVEEEDSQCKPRKPQLKIGTGQTLVENHPVPPLSASSACSLDSQGEPRRPVSL